MENNRVEKQIPVNLIEFDKLPINPSVLSLVDFLRNGGAIPPIKVVLSGKGSYILRDGRHRLCAFKLLGLEKINAKFSLVPPHHFTKKIEKI